MACAKCDFYTPKGSSRAQILEAKENLQKMRAMIPLTEDEQAAVDDGSARGAARPPHRRQRTPSGSRSIVFEGIGAGAFVDRADKAAEGIDLAARGRDREVIAALRQRRARLPAVGHRIIDVVIRSGGATDGTAQRMQLAVKRDRGDFRARRRLAAKNGEYIAAITATGTA